MYEGYATTGDGLRLHVRVVGEGEPAVLVPGPCYSEDDPAPLAIGRRLVFYDQRNRGRSDAVDDPARMGVEREARDLEAVRAHVGLERVVLLGWSYKASSSRSTRPRTRSASSARSCSAPSAYAAIPTPAS